MDSRKALAKPSCITSVIRCVLRVKSSTAAWAKHKNIMLTKYKYNWKKLVITNQEGPRDHNEYVGGEY